MNDIKYMNFIVDKLKNEYIGDDVPICAAVVLNDDVVYDYNDKILNNKINGHAEINAINKMCEKIGDWRLNGAVLYVSMFPCLMCIGAIIESRISKVVYGCINDKNYKHLELLRENNIEVVGPIMEKECAMLITNFFKEKRD